MSYNDNLPPGCSESDLPGNRPEDIRYERLIEEMDNYDGWVKWIEEDDAQKFEEYCFENFWNVLRVDFESLLHPESIDKEDPLGDNELAWSLFLWLVLSEERRNILVEAFIDSNRDDFERWVADQPEEEPEYERD